MERYGKWSTTTAENLAWGMWDGAMMMYQLYVDDGVPSRGHRTNIINPALTRVGIAYCNHSKMKNMLAITYAGGYEECSTGGTGGGN